MKIKDMMTKALEGAYTLEERLPYYKVAELLIGDDKLSAADTYTKINVIAYRVNDRIILLTTLGGDYLAVCRTFCREGKGCFCSSGIYLTNIHWEDVMKFRYEAYEALFDPCWQVNIYKDVDLLEDVDIGEN